MSGFQYDLGLTYFLTEWWGLGFKFNEFFASAETHIEEMSDQTRTKFLGPSVNFRMLDRNKKNSFWTDLSLGYLSYQNKAVVQADEFTINHNTVGFSWGLGYDIWLSASTSLGFQVSFLGGTSSRYTITEGKGYEKVKENRTLPDGQAEIFNRIDFSIGLRF
jgi:hypothetical protein